MAYGEPNWTPTGPLMNRSADRKPWSPGDWIYYPGEYKTTGLIKADSPRGKAGNEANRFIQRLINLPRE